MNKWITWLSIRGIAKIEERVSYNSNNIKKIRYILTDGKGDVHEIIVTLDGEKEVV